MKYDPYYYDGFAVYRKYLAYKLHFTTDKYDYTDHSGMVHTKLSTFTLFPTVTVPVIVAPPIT